MNAWESGRQVVQLFVFSPALCYTEGRSGRQCKGHSILSSMQQARFGDLGAGHTEHVGEWAGPW